MKKYSYKRLIHNFKNFKINNMLMVFIIPEIGEVKALIPPDKFPDDIFFITNNMEVHTYLKEFWEPYKDIKLNDKNYIGIIKKENEEYDYFFYTPISFEKVNFLYKEGNKNIIEINYKKYFFEGNLLKDLINQQNRKEKDMFYKKIRTLFGYIHEEKSIEKKFPIGLYKGCYPIEIL